MIILGRSFNHLAITGSDTPATIDFYTSTLGMVYVAFSNKLHAVQFGKQSYNINHAPTHVSPKALVIVPGSDGLPNIETLLPHAIHHLLAEMRPVRRSGAAGTLASVCFRHPDSDLVQVVNITG